MQQTETYKLNLIETDDNFSPNPLNENTQKLETTLAALNAGGEACAAEIAGLDQRLKVFEARRFAAGTFAGTGRSTDVALDFTPKVVIVHSGYGSKCAMYIEGQTSQNGSIHTNGFTITSSELYNLGGVYIAFT